MSREDYETFAADLAAFGAPVEAVEEMWAAAQAEEPDAGFLVHPDNVDAMRLAMALGTQWRTASLSTMGSAEVVKTGLDYSVLESTARLAGLELALPEDFYRLRHIEVEMLVEWQQQRARRR